MTEWGERTNGAGVFNKRKVDLKAFQQLHLRSLKACGSAGAVRSSHEQVIRNGFEAVGIIENTLVDMYAKCGALEEAEKVFNMSFKKSAVSWSVMIDGYVRHGHGHQAVELFNEMQLKGIKPSKVTYLCTLKACGKLASLEEGLVIHDAIVRADLGSDMVLGSTLVDMYGKCGMLDEAHKVFHVLPNKDVVSWNALIAGYTQHGHAHAALDLFQTMQGSGIEPANATVLCILKACGTIKSTKLGRLIHAQIIEKIQNSGYVLEGALIAMYSECARFCDAHKVFDSVSFQNHAAWATIITAYSQHGHGFLALETLECMQERNLKADKVIYLGVLKACGAVCSVRHGWLIHDQILRSGQLKDLAIGGALIDMYAKTGSLDEAQVVFDKLSYRNVVSWGTIIAGYVQHGYDAHAIMYFNMMILEDIRPTSAIFLSVLKACSNLPDIRQGQLVHCEIFSHCLYKTDLMIETALLNMYMKCGAIDEGHNHFNKMSIRDEASWNAMIGGCNEWGHEHLALILFEKMLENDVEPDKYTLSSLLQACGNLGAIGQGRFLHSMAIRISLHLDKVVGGTLVDMYARCGSLGEAHKVFNELPDHDVVLWGVLIAAYADIGDLRTCLKCFDDLQLQGLHPDNEIFSSMLAACSHGGEVNEGFRLFESMTRDHSIKPNVIHLNCMVDLFARTGCLNEAAKMVETMPLGPDIAGRMAMMNACRSYGSLNLGRQQFDQVTRLDRTVASGFMMISSIYADEYMWEEACKTQESRKCAGAWKKPACAWIEVEHKAHQFVLGDKLNKVDVIVKYDRIRRLMKDSGVVPHLNLVLKKLTMEEMDAAAPSVIA